MSFQGDCRHGERNLDCGLSFVNPLWAAYMAEQVTVKEYVEETYRRSELDVLERVAVRINQPEVHQADQQSRFRRLAGSILKQPSR